MTSTLTCISEAEGESTCHCEDGKRLSYEHTWKVLWASCAKM